MTRGLLGAAAVFVVSRADAQSVSATPPLPAAATSDAPTAPANAAPPPVAKDANAEDAGITTGAVRPPEADAVANPVDAVVNGAGEGEPTGAIARPKQGADGSPGEAGAAPKLRGTQDLPDQTFVAPDINPYVPFGRGSEDRRDAEDDFGVPTSRQEIQAPVQTPDFDLFEGPDGRPAPPANLRAGPATQNLRDPGGRTSEQTARRGATATTGSDPLASSAARGLTAADLTLPAGVVRTTRLDTVSGRMNLPIATALRGAIPLAQDDPFAPVGIRAGSFVLTSTIEQSLGVSDNLSQSVGGKSGVFSDTIGSLRLLSDWSRHEAELNAIVGYRHNFAGEPTSEPTVSLDGKLRFDVDRLTTATLRGSFEYTKDDPTATSVESSQTARQDVYTMSLGGEIKRQFGRADAGLDLSVLRSATSTLTDAAGVTSLDESYSTYTSALRAGYEISPALVPFVQASLGRRVFDTDRTDSGIERNALIEALRLGVAFDFSEKLRGEFATGYAWNVPDDASLATKSAPTIDASIAWSPQRGTNVVLTAGTSFDPDTDSNTTSTLYQGSLALRHKATARTDVTAALSASYRDSETASDSETTYAAETGFTYWLNRSLALTGLLRHAKVDSEAPGSDYSENTARVGIKLQR